MIAKIGEFLQIRYTYMKSFLESSFSISKNRGKRKQYLDTVYYIHITSIHFHEYLLPFLEQLLVLTEIKIILVSAQCKQFCRKII